MEREFKRYFFLTIRTLGLDRRRILPSEEQDLVSWLIDTNSSKGCTVQVHLTGHCSPVHPPSAGHHDPLLPYLCVSQGYHDSLLLYLEVIMILFYCI